MHGGDIGRLNGSNIRYGSGGVIGRRVAVPPNELASEMAVVREARIVRHARYRLPGSPEDLRRVGDPFTA